MTGQQRALTALDDAVELVLRHHLPVPVGSALDVLCLCDVRQTYTGPVGHRLHVAAELRNAGSAPRAAGVLP